MAGSRCKECNRFIKAKYAYGTGLCYRCYKQSGGNTMIKKVNTGFRKVVHTPRTVRENPSMQGKLSGRDNAIFLKNRYQQELDATWTAIINMVHWLERRNSELKKQYSKVPKLKKDIEAHEEERAKAYTNLGNVLKKETDFEEKMWDKTLKGRKVKSITVKQKFKDSDIDEMRYDSMMDYLKSYPEYASKSTFKRVLDKIDKVESEIRDIKKKYNEAVSEYNANLYEFEITIKKVDDKFGAYDHLKKEAEEKLYRTRYNKGFLSKLRSEQKKAEANIDIISHRTEQFRNTLNIIKSEHSGTQRTQFKEVEY
ncbi:hypothetical protein HOA91_06075 [Candidatus Woesearchaeota archaeon]|jgi:hypothetical protein|nr:hypothetical protein [Candidatus Woesearchaeota archaeon]